MTKTKKRGNRNTIVLFRETNACPGRETNAAPMAKKKKTTKSNDEAKAKTMEKPTKTRGSKNVKSNQANATTEQKIEK
jgi:hypothetical protein